MVGSLSILMGGEQAEKYRYAISVLMDSPNGFRSRSVGKPKSNIHLYSTYMGRRGDISGHLLWPRRGPTNERAERWFPGWPGWSGAAYMRSSTMFCVHPI